MRDINRIDTVLKELGDVWKKFPDMRLGQLLLNTLNDSGLYYIEDDKLVECVKEFYKQ